MYVTIYVIVYIIMEADIDHGCEQTQTRMLGSKYPDHHHHNNPEVQLAWYVDYVANTN